MVMLLTDKEIENFKLHFGSITDGELDKEGIYYLDEMRKGMSDDRIRVDKSLQDKVSRNMKIHRLTCEEMRRRVKDGFEELRNARSR